MGASEQIAKMEELETQLVAADEVSGKFMKVMEGLGGMSVEQAENSVKAEQALSDYNEAATEMSKTLGFDVMPIMKAIIGTDNDMRQSFAQTIISVEENNTAMQKLSSSNAAAKGMVQNLKDEVDGLTESLENLSKITDKTDIAAQQIESDNKLGNVLDANREKRIKANKAANDQELADNKAAAEEDEKIERNLQR